MYSMFKSEELRKLLLETKTNGLAVVSIRLPLSAVRMVKSLLIRDHITRPGNLNSKIEGATGFPPSAAERRQLTTYILVQMFIKAYEHGLNYISLKRNAIEFESFDTYEKDFVKKWVTVCAKAIKELNQKHRKQKFELYYEDTVVYYYDTFDKDIHTYRCLLCDANEFKNSTEAKAHAETHNQKMQ